MVADDVRAESTSPERDPARAPPEPRRNRIAEWNRCPVAASAGHRRDPPAADGREPVPEIGACPVLRSHRLFICGRARIEPDRVRPAAGSRAAATAGSFCLRMDRRAAPPHEFRERPRIGIAEDLRQAGRAPREGGLPSARVPTGPEETLVSGHFPLKTWRNDVPSSRFRFPELSGEVGSAAFALATVVWSSEVEWPVFRPFGPR